MKPETLGQHLRKRRFSLGMRQSQAAQELQVSDRTLSLWECDRAYPTWRYHKRLIDYLGYDPFPACGLQDPMATNPNSLPFYRQRPSALGSVRGAWS